MIGLWRVPIIVLFAKIVRPSYNILTQFQYIITIANHVHATPNVLANLMPRLPQNIDFASSPHLTKRASKHGNRNVYMLILVLLCGFYWTWVRISRTKTGDW